MQDEQVNEETQPELEQTVEQAVETPQEGKQEESEEKDTQPKKKNAEYNFAQLRKEREAAERRAQEAERRLGEVLELSKQIKGTQNQEQRDLIEEEISKLSRDDLATIDHVDKIYSKREKAGKKEIERIKNEMDSVKSQLEEYKFRAKYPDLDEVITEDNIALLKQEDPEIAEMLSRLPQGSKEQVTLVYKYIKRLIPVKQEEPIEKKKAIENSKKPVSVQAIAKQSAIGNAHMFENGLTPDLKKQLWKEMQDSMKRG